jgi:hypothetical protein
MTNDDRSRRRFLRSLCTIAGGVLVAGCDNLSSKPGFTQMLAAAERLNRTLHHALAPRKSMAQEFSEADLSPYFRSNGTDNPDDPHYQALARSGFADWRLCGSTVWSSGPRSYPSRSYVRCPAVRR